MENRKNFTLRKADAPTHRRIFIYTIGHSAVKSPTSRKPPLRDAMEREKLNGLSEEER